MRRYALLLCLILAFPCSVSARELPRGVAWLREFARTISVPPVVRGDMAVIVATDRAYGLNTTDGAERWSLELPGECASNSRVPELANAVILPVTPGFALCLDVQNGRQLWRSPAELMSPQLSNGRLIVVHKGWVQALDPSTGQVRWRSSERANLKKLEVHGASVLVAGEEELTLWDLSTGKRSWRQRVGTRINDIGIGPQRTYAIEGYAGETALVCRRLRDGQPLWRRPQTDGFALMGERLVCWNQAPRPYHVTALSPRDGRVLWQTEFPTLISMAATAGSDLLAVGDGWRFFFLNPRSGAKMRRMEQSYFQPFVDGDRVLLPSRLSNLLQVDARSTRPLPTIAGVHGEHDAWGTDAFKSPGGVSAGKLKLLPAGPSLIALGEGDGSILMAGPATVNLQLGRAYGKPHVLEVTVFGSFHRGFTISAYRWPGSPEPDLTTLKPVLRIETKTPAGVYPVNRNLIMDLREPGTYTIEAKAGDAVTRETLRLP